MPAIDPTSPVPLYHQIAQVLRARIESGELAPGDVLEPLRDAAADWKVNFHTVRHAYAELARDGLVEMRGPRGTHVLGAGPGPTGPARGTPATKPAPAPRSPQSNRDLATFLATTLQRAERDYELSARELSAHLLEASTSPARPRLCVLECSEHQCEDLARQIEAAWNVDAVPWCLEGREALPENDVVATHFHYNEIRLRWPDRLASTFFVPIAPDPAIPSAIERRLGNTTNATLVLCERDAPTAEAVAADLSILLPPTYYPLRIEVLPDPSPATLDSIEGDLLLLPPRVWGSLPPARRKNKRFLEVRYLYDAQQLEETALRLGWTSARTSG